MDKNLDQYQHIQQLLEKEKSGRLSDAESIELAQIRANDPFLVDALEGYIVYPDIDHVSRIKQLKERITKKTDQRRRITPFWLRAAALLLLLIASGWLIRGAFTNNKEQTFTTSERDKKIMPEITPPAISDADLEPSLVIVEELESEITPEATLKTYSESSRSPIHQDESSKSENTESLLLLDGVALSDEAPGPTIRKTKESTPGPESGTIDFVEGGSTPNEKDEPMDSTMQELSTNPSTRLKHAANAMSQINVEKTIMGIVMDPSGTPLIGASVYEVDSENGMITDMEGRFSISLEDRSHQVIVSYVGYADYTLSSKNLGTYVEVELQEMDQQLDEIVKTSRVQSLEKQDTELVFIQAQPSIGLKRFERYITNNARYPNSMTGDMINGIVQVQFLINEQGEPVSFKIKSSFNPVFNAEAIRLIQQGGKWKTKPRNQIGWVTYDVPF